MSKVDTSLSLAHPQAHSMRILDKVGLGIGSLGLLLLLIASFGASLPNPGLWLTVSLVAMALGTVLYAHGIYSHLPEGIKNNGAWFKSMTSRGAVGWITGILLTGFYVLLYWFPTYLGLGADGATNRGMVGFFDPLSYALKGQPASQWFVYGALYTTAIIALGYKFILKYRHNRYQTFRTLSVMFFQLGFAFLLPELLARLSMSNEALSSLPYNDFKNMWPLNYYFFDGWNVKSMLASGNLGLFMLFWGVAMIFIVSPFLTYFYGKRWYCSW
ncbi:MAG: FeS-binding protein, partial [Bacteroidota bacterium]